MTQDEAGKTPELPRWHNVTYGEIVTGVCQCSDGKHGAKGRGLAHYFNELEGALREAKEWARQHSEDRLMFMLNDALQGRK